MCYVIVTLMTFGN